MNKKKIAGLCISICLMLTGCQNGIPQMTAEQEDQIVDYAASIALKYDSNYSSRLVELDKESDSEKSHEDNREAEVSKEDQDVSKPGGNSIKNEVDQTALDWTTIEEFYHMDGISIQYTGFQIEDSYLGEHRGELYFSMDATEGKKLLILSFEVENITSEEINLDFLEIAPRFSVFINEKKSASILPTMLIDDMVTYVGTLSGGEILSLVMIAEVPTEDTDNIQTVELMMWNSSSTMKMKIQ